jgi:hypothetical protein
MEHIIQGYPDGPGHPEGGIPFREKYQAGGYDTCHVKLVRLDTTHASLSPIELLVVAVHEAKI